jgi:hypothetical protein
LKAFSSPRHLNRGHFAAQSKGPINDVVDHSLAVTGAELRNSAANGNNASLPASRGIKSISPVGPGPCGHFGDARSSEFPSAGRVPVLLKPHMAAARRGRQYCHGLVDFEIDPGLVLGRRRALAGSRVSRGLRYRSLALFRFWRFERSLKIGACELTGALAGDTVRWQSSLRRARNNF